MIDKYINLHAQSAANAASFACPIQIKSIPVADNRHLCDNIEHMSKVSRNLNSARMFALLDSIDST